MTDTMLITIICVSVVLLIGLFVIFSKRKTKTKIEENTPVVSETTDDKKSEDKRSSSVIKYSDNYTPPKTETIIDTKHKIKVILKDDIHVKRWICPECEVENNISDSKCCVCNWHYVK